MVGGGKRGGTASETSIRSEEDEDVAGWGSSRKDYYNADVIETEADALEEEQEAIRLQKKQLQGMTEADYGFDETEWLSADKSEGQGDNSERDATVREALPQLEIAEALGPEERSKIFSMRYPEFDPLAKEFIALQSMHEELQTEISALQAIETHHARTGIDHSRSNTQVLLNNTIKHSTLTAYLAALSMYFAIVTSGSEDEDGRLKAITPAKLRDHPIMESLLKCRSLWEKVKNLQVQDRYKISERTAREMANIHIGETSIRTDDFPEETKVLDSPHPVKKKKKRRKSKSERAAEAAILEADSRRAERLRKNEEELAELTASTSVARKSSEQGTVLTAIQATDDDLSDFGEETTLTAHEAAEKAKRKRGLRFYTSQIAQKANKRDTAGRDAGGDADIPYRERFKDKQARLNVEAEGRGNKKTDANSVPLGGDSDEEDRKLAKDVRGQEGDEEDYYDMITARTQKKKAEKAALAVAQKRIEQEGGVVQLVEEVGADGKRAITYAIEKNKGLAPKRKKDVRNPRVKKRKKYEDKKKKLGSIRPVYKGGEGRGGYGGELTGIKKGLVRSIKL